MKRTSAARAHESKTQKRKRKLEHRARRTRDTATRHARRNKFPEFVFDTYYADPDFVAVVKAAVRAFDFDELGVGERLFFELVRDEGADTALETLRTVIEEVRIDDPTNLVVILGEGAALLSLGEHVLRKIPAVQRRVFFPLHDFRIFLRGNEVVVQCSSLCPLGTRAFYSRHRPTVEFDGKAHVVAFSRAAIEKIQRRVKGTRTNYGALGDINAYFELCNHFEPCVLPLAGAGSGEGPAIAIFDTCATPGFAVHSFVTEVLGPTHDASQGAPYYRLGYCPVALEDGFAIAKSFLPPGFRKTPEYAAIHRARLPYEERRRLEAMATDDGALVRLIESGDFSAVRRFHESGVPQVVQSKERWFRGHA